MKKNLLNVGCCFCVQHDFNHSHLVSGGAAAVGSEMEIETLGLADLIVCKGTERRMKRMSRLFRVFKEGEKKEEEKKDGKKTQTSSMMRII